MTKVAITTFGCKLNQAESAQISEILTRNNYLMTDFDSAADVYVINTCTVTAKADARCRQAIRKARRLAPEAKIIVTGCYAEVAPHELEQIPGVDYIVGSDFKFKILDYLTTPEKNPTPVIHTCGYDGHPAFITENSGFFLENTRAFLKIQDGCNAFCSYCIVPYARGRSRSGAVLDLRKQFKTLLAREFKEIVLTGAHIGMFGQDFNRKLSLKNLLEEFLEIDGNYRIRLSSLEPLEISPDLIDLIAGTNKICSHMHIPLQSGDNEILKKMNRHYSCEYFRDTVQMVAEKLPGCGLGTDVIVGFPGEMEPNFENTFQLINELPFTYLHVFAYSIRKGTPAARFKPQIAKPVQMERSKRLRQLGDLKRKQFYNFHINKKIPVLFEEELEPGWLTGLGPDYVRIKAKADNSVINQIVPVEIVEAEREMLIGVIEKHTESD